jgi:hypothetical protein
MDLIAAAIEAIEPDAVVTVDAVARTVRVETDGVVITSSNFVVTAGQSQATAVSVDSSDAVFDGVSVHNHNVGGKYVQYDSMSVLKKGRVWATSSVTMTKDDDVYVDLAGGLGKFTNVSTNNLATGGKVVTGNDGAGLFEIEL